MRWCAFVCLLLGVVSSAPLTSEGDSSSSSDEDLQLPAVIPVVVGASQQAPPSMILKVEDTKTNVTLSFAIFILPEEEEGGSGMDGGRSDNSSDSDVSSEEMTSQMNRPITSLLHSSEEMMSDQPMLFSDEGIDVFNDDCSKTTAESEVDLRTGVSDGSDGQDNSATPTEPPFSLPVDSSDLFSSQDPDPGQNLQGVTLNQGNQSLNIRQQGQFGPDTVVRAVLDPVSQEVKGSGSEITNAATQTRVRSSRGSISNNDGGGSRLQEALHSIIGPLSGIQRLMRGVGTRGGFLGSTLNWVPVSQDSSSPDESSEPVHFSRVSSDLETKPSLSSESPEATDGTQNGTGSTYSKNPDTGLTKTSTSASVILDGDRRGVQGPSGTSVQAGKDSALDRPSPDQDMKPVMPSIPKNTISRAQGKDRTRFLSWVNVGLISDSSEESQQSDRRPKASSSNPPGPELHRAVSPGLSSSSEEILSISFSSSPRPSKESESEELGADSGSKPVSPGLDSSSESQSSELHPDPVPTPHFSPEFNPTLNQKFSSSSEISQEQTQNANTPKNLNPKPTAESRASTVSTVSMTSSSELRELPLDPTTAPVYITRHVSSGASSDAKDAVSSGASSDAKDAGTRHVSSGASSDAKDAGTDLSAEEDEDVTKDVFTVTMTPTVTHLPNSRSNANANANVEGELAGSETSTEASTDANQHPTPLPPRRRKPFRFGYLGPISHTYGNGLNSQHNVDRKLRPKTPHHWSVRKPTKVRLAKVAKLAQSSSEETK